MKLVRKEAGVYYSRDERLSVKRYLSYQTGRCTETVWEVYLDGKQQGIGCGTLREARLLAEKVYVPNEGQR